MKLPSAVAYPLTLVLILFVVAGCTSLGGTADPAKYDKMSCTELNSALGTNAGEISQNRDHPRQGRQHQCSALAAWRLACKDCSCQP